MIVWYVQKNSGVVIGGANITDGMIISEDQTKAELNGAIFSAPENCFLIEHNETMLDGIGAIYDFSTKIFNNPLIGEDYST